jgi:hypothetical protein
MMSRAGTSNGGWSRARRASRGEVRRDCELHLELSCVVIRMSDACGRCHRQYTVSIESPRVVSRARDRRWRLSGVGN